MPNERGARVGDLCGTRYNVSVALFWFNKADLHAVLSWPLIFFSLMCISTGEKEKSLLDALKALFFPSLTKVGAYLLKFAAQWTGTTSLGA